MIITKSLVYANKKLGRSKMLTIKLQSLIFELTQYEIRHSEGQLSCHTSCCTER